MMNAGGLRAPIPKGPVSSKCVFAENDLVVTKLSGKKVKALFDYFIETTAASAFKNAPSFLGMNSVNINGNLDENQSYYVLTNDYLQNGGDGMDFFAAPEAVGLNYKVRNAILDYFTKVDLLEATLDDRVIVKK